MGSAQNSHEDEEWDDYRENKKDYSGLKIESLTIEDHAPEEEEDETEINEDGEVVVKAKNESGPWNKMAGSGNNESQQILIQEPEPTIQTPNVVGGSYVPPAKRGGVGAMPPVAEQRRPLGKRNKTAPDITSEVYFPSLSSAVEDGGPKGAWGKPRAGTVETSRRSESAAVKDTHDKPRLRGWLSETSLPPSEKEIKRCTGVLEIRTATTSAFHYVPMILYTHPSLYSFINL